MTRFENYQAVSRQQLEGAHKEMMEFFRKNGIQRVFDKYAECFWILFNDSFCSYMWAVDTVCKCFPECNRAELEKTLDRYI